MKQFCIIALLFIVATGAIMSQSVFSGSGTLSGQLSFGGFLPNGWSTRSTGVNVAGGAASIVRALNLDSETGFAHNSTSNFGDGFATDGSSFQDSLDTTTKADSYAGAGSIKLNVPLNSIGNTSGDLHFNALSDMSLQFGEGQEFYIQFREMIGSEFLTRTNFPNSEGFKSLIISEGDRSSPHFEAQSCSASPDEIVVQQNIGGANPYSPKLYTNCARTDPGFQPYWQIQQGEPNFGLDFLEQLDLPCAHYGGRGIPFADPNCWTYHASEFFTIQVHVKVGTWATASSLLELWFAHGNQPSQLLISVVDWKLANDNTSLGRYGKFWLIPYQTAMSGSLVQTQVWYDDVIVSTRRIPDPDTGVPNAPDSLALSIVSTTAVDVSWRSNSSNGGSNDDTGFKIERCSGTSADCHANQNYSQVGTVGAGVTIFHDTGLTHAQQYQYRVRASNSVGNSAYAAGTCLNTSTNPCGESVTP